MPELPEVETIRRFLKFKITGLAIRKIDILTTKSFIGNPRQIINQKITRLTRLGKQLSIHLSNDLVLLFHLKMTGQLILVPPLLRGGPEGGGVSKTTRIIFTFNNQSQLFFNDQRKFGWVKLLDSQFLSSFQRNLGLDLLDPGFTLKYFSSRLNSSRPVKLVLLDQSRFAGIGNIYTNEALFLAQIHPSLPAGQLTPAQIKKLYQAVKETVSEALIHQGSTARDDHYRLPDGSRGSHQSHFRVYQRAGKPCPVCAAAIVRFSLNVRPTFYCPSCQENPSL